MTITSYWEWKKRQTPEASKPLNPKTLKNYKLLIKTELIAKRALKLVDTHKSIATTEIKTTRTNTILANPTNQTKYHCKPPNIKYQYTTEPTNHTH
jgi:hypothetical protein